MANSCTSAICKRLTEMMSEGATLQEVAADVGYDTETFRVWRDPKSPYYEREFAEAYKKAKPKQFAWWAREGRTSLRDREFSPTLYGLFMANMFGWRSGASRDDEAMQEIKKLKEQLGIED
jgi:hypothetical protein